MHQTHCPVPSLSLPYPLSGSPPITDPSEIGEDCCPQSPHVMSSCNYLPCLGLCQVHSDRGLSDSPVVPSSSGGHLLCCEQLVLNVQKWEAPVPVQGFMEASLPSLTTRAYQLLNLTLLPCLL